MNDLVDRLSNGSHRVDVSLRPEKTVKVFKECIDRGYVLIRFVDTRGGTELGVPVDPEGSNLRDADFDSRSGQVTIAGALTLDYERVRCIAHIDLASLSGDGRLERIEATS